MPEEEFIIAVLCRAGDLLQSAPDLRGTRRRGFAPRPCDSGVITMEVAGEFLGMDGDKAVRGHFRRHWQCPFPGLGPSSAFVRQAANPWLAKQGPGPCCPAGWGAGATRSTPPTASPCQCGSFARAARCRLFRGVGRLRPLRLQGGDLPRAAGRSGREPQRDRRQHPGAAHRRQGLHPPPAEDDLGERGSGLQTPLRKNMPTGGIPASCGGW